MINSKKSIQIIWIGDMSINICWKYYYLLKEDAIIN